MKNRVAILVILFAATTVYSQDRPTIAAQPNTVFVGADGKFEAAPDTVRVEFNISAQEDTAPAAYDRAAKNAEQIRQILRSNGIDAKTAEIGFFSLQPVYDWRTAKRKLVAYRVNSAVSLKLKDFSKVAPLVEQLAATDVTANQSVNYSLEDIDAAKVKAVEDAFRHARENAAAVARAGGRVLGELSYASVDTAEQIRIMTPLAAQPMTAMRAQAETPTPTAEFSPENVQVRAHVNAMFNLK